MILIPIPVYNNITEKEEATTLALVTINLANLRTIEENLETGFADIYYNNNGCQETKIPFPDMLKFFLEQGAVNTTFSNNCNYISPAVDSVLKTLT